MIMISLKQLRFFDALARFRHFGKAADHCAVTQPALSMQIQELEKEIGATLVERRPRHMTLTPAGRDIARRAAKILADIHDIADAARTYRGILSGPLNLGVIPTVAPYVLPNLLSMARTRHPQLQLNVRETQTATLIDELQNGRLDVLLLALPIETPDIETLALFKDRFVLAAPLQFEKPTLARANDIIGKDSRLLLLEEGHCFRDQALAYCATRRILHLDTFATSSLSTLVQLVVGGMGLTLLPEISLAVETAHLSVELLRFDSPEPYRTLGLAWRASSPRREDYMKLGELIVASRAGSSANDQSDETNT